MAIHLTRIYTRLGDGGETHLGDMSRVPKDDPRVEAYGTVDELNSLLGVVLVQPKLPPRFVAWLRRVQNDLLDLGADLAVPLSDGHERLRIDEEYVTWLEEACDTANSNLEPLHSFVIPGGNPVSAHLHLARTICRRAERRVFAVQESNPEVLRYLNRLSDLLFILAHASGEISQALWDPGAHGLDHSQ